MADEYASKESVERAFKRIETLEGAVSSLREQQAITSTLVDTLKQMPELFSELQLTLMSVSKNLESVESKVDNTSQKVDSIESSLKSEIQKVKKDVDSVEDKGKIDFVLWLKNKWFEIVVGLVTLSMIIKDISK